jgi:UDP:flavonoid glycosyltransferase YjiC (YdhE family)
MRVLLVTRGSQGDIYPYLELAKNLMQRGHSVMLALPEMFAKIAEAYGIPLLLMKDDIAGMVGEAKNTKDLLAWTKRVIAEQFRDFTPILREYDALIASNTEFAAPSIAEYCGKPFVRTAYGPFLPGKKIPPPVMPFPKPHPVIRPAFLWGALNAGLNLMVKKTINAERAKLGMKPIRDQADHAPRNARNFLMYSPSLGNVDPDWPYPWAIGGYCFNDDLPYNERVFERLSRFINKDERPVLFFTLGSCRAKNGEQFCETILSICEKHGYKFVVGTGWWKLGEHLLAKNNVFVLDEIIPHHKIMPFFTAVMHHGGSGTTHSVARFGKPQIITPLLLDQHYWGYRAHQLGLGPENINIADVKRQTLENSIVDLMTNQAYRKNAAALSEKIQAEKGCEALCKFIEETAS